MLIPDDTLRCNFESTKCGTYIDVPLNSDNEDISIHHPDKTNHSNFIEFNYSPEIDGLPVVAICLVGFDNAKGGVICDMYPDTKIANQHKSTSIFYEYPTTDLWLGSGVITGNITNELMSQYVLPFIPMLAIPDGTHMSSHLVRFQSSFFLLPLPENKFLYGTSIIMPHCDIEAASDRTEQQTAIVAILRVPFLSLFHNKLLSLVQTSNKIDSILLSNIYSSLNTVSSLSPQHLRSDLCNCSFFQKYSFKHILTLIHSVLSRLNVIIYSTNSSDLSFFLFSFLSLFPGGNLFNFFSHDFGVFKHTFETNGLPFVLFDTDYVFYPITSLHFMNALTHRKYFIGTTNSIVKDQILKETVDVFYDIDNNYMDKKRNNGNSKVYSTSKKEVKYFEEMFSRFSDQSMIIDSSVISAKFTDYFLKVIRDIQILNMTSNNNQSFFINKTYYSGLQTSATISKYLLPRLSKLNQVTNLSRISSSTDPVSLYFPNGDEYHGYIRNKQRNGSGIYKSKMNKYTFDGIWKNDCRHGHGQLVVSGANNDFIYEGDWRDDVCCGTGKIVYSYGLKYEGTWHRNKFDGKGTLITENGVIYEGEWKKGQRHGLGKLRKSLNDNTTTSFCGEFKKDRPHGKGYLIYNGVCIDGYYKNGEIHGTCKFLFPDTLWSGEAFFVNNSRISGDFTFNGKCVSHFEANIDVNGHEGNILLKPNSLLSITFENGEQFTGNTSGEGTMNKDRIVDGYDVKCITMCSELLTCVHRLIYALSYNDLFGDYV